MSDVIEAQQMELEEYKIALVAVQDQAEVARKASKEQFEDLYARLYNLRRSVVDLADTLCDYRRNRPEHQAANALERNAATIADAMEALKLCP